MHRSKIEWVDDVWNPITGCLKTCRYCYAVEKAKNFSGDIRRNMAQHIANKEDDLFILEKPFASETGHILTYPFGFKPTYHHYRLDYPARRKNGCNILVGESGEIFGEWVAEKYIREILTACEEHPEHNYFFLTKNPDRYGELASAGLLPDGDNMWYGYSYTAAGCARWTGNGHTFLCADPLLGDLDIFEQEGPAPAEWVIVGAEVGSGREVVIPKREWVEKITNFCERHNIPVFMRESMVPIVGEKHMRREYPNLKRTISPKVKARLEGTCCDCGNRFAKVDMIALCARSQRGEAPKQFAHLCKTCFHEFTNRYGIREDRDRKTPKVLEGDCCRCKIHTRKNDMIALCARYRRGEFPQQLTYICKACFRKLCSDYGVDPPNLERLKEGFGAVEKR